MNPAKMDTTDRFLYESNLIEDEPSKEAFDDAKEAWEYLVGHKELTHNVVRSVHSILMQRRTTIDDTQKGGYREQEVSVGGRGGLAWTRIHEAMTSWLNHQHDAKNWKAWHVMYEKIHPFLDGNGRTGRMFMNWHRLKLGLPILVIKESEKEEYYSWFKDEWVI